MLDDTILVPMPDKNITLKKQIYVYLILKGYRNKSGKPTSDSVAIGKKDLKTGMLIPNQRYYEYFQKTKPQKDNSNQCVPNGVSKVYRIGCCKVLDRVVKEIGLLDIIQEVFPDNWDEIMTVAFYMATDSNIMYLIDDWLEEVAPPFGVTLDSKTCSELFASISFAQRDTFFSEWIKK